VKVCSKMPSLVVLNFLFDWDVTSFGTMESSANFIMALAAPRAWVLDINIDQESLALKLSLAEYFC